MPELNLNSNLAEDEIQIDLRAYLKVLQKWRKFIALGTLACVLTSGILSFFFLPPVYESKTLLQVTQPTDREQVIRNQQGSLEDVVSSVSRLPVMTMNTYLGQLNSEALMQRVIQKLKLDPGQYSPGVLSGMIKATVVKDSNLIDVRVQCGDPQLAAQIANTLSKEYLQLISDKNLEQMTRSVLFLKQQRESVDKELQTAVEALKKSQAQPRGVAVLEQEFQKKSEDMATFDSQLNRADVELQQLSAGVNQLEREKASTPSTVSLEKLDPVTGKVVTTQDVNPVYVSLAQQLSQKKEALAEKEAEVQGVEAMVEFLRQDLDALQAELTEKKVQQEKLQTEVDRLKQTSETLAQKTTETQIAKSIDLGDTSLIVVSEASISAIPVKPNKKLNVVLGFILGLMVFTALAFVLEYLDNTIKTPEDVSKILELPVIGVIPMNRPEMPKRSYGG